MHTAALVTAHLRWRSGAAEGEGEGTTTGKRPHKVATMLAGGASGGQERERWAVEGHRESEGPRMGWEEDRRMPGVPADHISLYSRLYEWVVSQCVANEIKKKHPKQSQAVLLESNPAGHIPLNWKKILYGFKNCIVVFQAVLRESNPRRAHISDVWLIEGTRCACRPSYPPFNPAQVGSSKYVAGLKNIQRSKRSWGNQTPARRIPKRRGIALWKAPEVGSSAVVAGLKMKFPIYLSKRSWEIEPPPGTYLGRNACMRSWGIEPRRAHTKWRNVHGGYPCPSSAVVNPLLALALTPSFSPSTSRLARTPPSPPNAALATPRAPPRGTLPITLYVLAWRVGGGAARSFWCVITGGEGDGGRKGRGGGEGMEWDGGRKWGRDEGGEGCGEEPKEHGWDVLEEGGGMKTGRKRCVRKMTGEGGGRRKRRAGKGGGRRGQNKREAGRRNRGWDGVQDEGGQNKTDGGAVQGRRTDKGTGNEEREGRAG
ncbi:hypothetical protein B0H17DRAFT_1151524 [Mycena rosella]|uniref:Uncharacterized protein n=1 Tax=Mycena rosella TaxID=1033263 RepID=A0AAD7BJX5_MYCRO|nr:hypothetical protein B0H17DRAFT_1151524 [Mycena rosella]